MSFESIGRRVDDALFALKWRVKRLFGRESIRRQPDVLTYSIMKHAFERDIERRSGFAESLNRDYDDAAFRPTEKIGDIVHVRRPPRYSGVEMNFTQQEQALADQLNKMAEEQLARKADFVARSGDA